MEKTKKSEYIKEVVKILIVYVLIVAIALLISKVSTYASEVETEDKMYEYHLICRGTNKLYLYDFTFKSEKEIVLAKNSNGVTYGMVIDNDMDSVFSAGFSFGDSYEGTTTVGDVVYDYPYVNYFSIEYTHEPFKWTGKIFDSSHNAIMYCQNGSLDGLIQDSIDSSIVDDDSIHDSTLGYLSNLTVDFLQVNSTEESYYQYTWDDLSTSGIDLKNDNIKIECWVAYTGAWADGYIGTKDEINYKTYDKRFYKYLGDSEKPLIIQKSDLFNSVLFDDMSHFNENYSGNGISMYGVQDNYSAYFRIVRINEDGTINYGDFIAYDCRLGFTDYIRTEDKDGNQTFDNEEVGSGQDYNRGSGVGETLEDAQTDALTNNKQSDELTFDFDSLLDNADKLGEWFLNLFKSLFNAIGKVPQLISNTLVFLPKEIMLFLSAGIVIVVILRIFGR